MGANFANPGFWEAITFSGDTGDAITVKNSIVTIDASAKGVPPEFGYGIDVGYNTGDVTIDNVYVTPFTGLASASFTFGYGVWINGGSGPGRDITITNSSFDGQLGRFQSIAIDRQVGAPAGLLAIHDNFFGAIGPNGLGAIRVEDFNVLLPAGPLDYTGIHDNTFFNAPASPGGDQYYGLIRNGSGHVVTIGESTYGNGGGPTYDQVITAFSTTSGQTLNGGALADIIVGSNAAGSGDTITGGAGNDVIFALAGNDTINYVVGDGLDTVNGGTETTGDTLNVSNAGGAAETITVATAGTDPITVDFAATGGTEISATEIENIAITMGSNGDTVNVNGDFTGTSLSVSTITVTGGLGNDTVNASGLTSTHRIVFTGGAGTDIFTGGAGNDTFVKTAGADAGDTFTGGLGSDTIDYGAITSGVTVDLTGGAGTDTLNGVENVTGTNQADTITVSSTANTVLAGDGDDIILIANGSDAAGDTLDGGVGTNDRIRFISTLVGDTLTLNGSTAGIESVTISDAAGVTTGTTALNVNVSAVSGAISLTGNDGDNVLTGNGSANTIIGGGGADTINAGAGSDTVSAGNGNDTVIGTADGVSDIYNGGSGGTDTIDYSALLAGESISVNLQTGAASGTAIGSDNLSGTSFENAKAGGGNNSVFGSLGNNTLHGGGGTDNMVGGGGSDTLFGEAGDDTLNGGVNDFALTPAAANDVLWGGADTDTFRFEGRFGDDAIGTAGTPDWTDGEDLLFVGYGPEDPPIIVDVTDGVLITVDDGSIASSVFVAGATSAQMNVSIVGLDLLIQ